MSRALAFALSLALSFAAADISSALEINVLHCGRLYAGIDKVARQFIAEIHLDHPPSEYGLPLRELKDSLKAKPVRAKGMANVIRHGVMTSSQGVRELDPAGFMRMLEPGRKYTYVLQDDKLVFAPTGTEAVENLFSKHMVLGKFKKVAYGGELWVDEAGLLHVTNGSGSYTPDAALLDSVGELFKRNFGLAEVRVQAFDQ